MAKKYIAMCGLDCASCAAFIATKNNDNKLREKTAKEWTKRYVTSRNRPPVKPEDINCHGCLSKDTVYFYCHSCEVRNCSLKKKLKNCQDCDEYRCAKLIELQKHFF